MDTRRPRKSATALSRLPCWTPLRGDGHGVLVLPGFAAGDPSTAPLRWALQAHGYAAQGWGLGRNVGLTRRITAGLRARLAELASGQRISLVGWSLGGIYARQLARERPDLIRQVITMGSPFRTFEGRYSRPLGMPVTSIYTRDDGVVRWHHCIDELGASRQASNIEVYGTHIDLGVNPAVIFAVLDRLGQPEDAWQPFRPPLALRPLYPAPASWSPRGDAA
jgi:pimeloyl-ACP methyl ester carboxylesterase